MSGILCRIWLAFVTVPFELGGGTDVSTMAEWSTTCRSARSLATLVAISAKQKYAVGARLTLATVLECVATAASARFNERLLQPRTAREFSQCTSGSSLDSCVDP